MPNRAQATPSDGSAAPASLAARRSKLTEQLYELQSTVDTLKNTLQGLYDRVQHVDGRQKDSETGINTRLNKFDSAVDGLEALHERCAENMSDTKVLQTAHQTQASVVADLSARVSALEGRAAELTSTLQRSCESLASAQDRLSRQQDQVTSMQTAHDGLMSRWVQLLEALKSQRSQEEKRFEELKASLGEEITRTRKTMADEMKRWQLSQEKQLAEIIREHTQLRKGVEKGFSVLGSGITRPDFRLSPEVLAEAARLFSDPVPLRPSEGDSSTR